jgi:hypothetical protein
MVILARYKEKNVLCDDIRMMVVFLQWFREIVVGS